MINISETLIANISKNYIFYFPSSIYDDIELSFIAGIIPKDAYDIIAYNKEAFGATTQNVDNIAPIGIIQKKTILQNNLLLLLDNKTKVNADVFKFILDDYKKHIDSHLFITSWLANNVTTAFPDLSATLLNAFKNQSQFFKDHYGQLGQHFQLSPEAPQLEKTDLLETFKKILPDTNLKTETPEDINRSTPKTSKRVKKEKLKINDEDTELYLLKTVFNVDISLYNN